MLHDLGDTKSLIFNLFRHKNAYGTNIKQEHKSLPLDAAVLRNEGTNAGAFTFGMKGFAFTLSECSRAFRSLVSSLVSPGPGSSKESHESGAFASELLGSIPWSWLLEDILIVQNCNIFLFSDPREMVQFPRRLVRHWACFDTTADSSSGTGGSRKFPFSSLLLSFPVLQFALLVSGDRLQMFYDNKWDLNTENAGLGQGWHS